MAETLKAGAKQVAATAALKAILAHLVRRTTTSCSASLRRPNGRRRKFGRKPTRRTARPGRRDDPSVSVESLRVRLAKYMLSPETPPALYDQLWVCLKERKPANLAAQIVLYQNGRSDRKTQQWLEASFVVQSGGAMSRLLGVPAPQQREAASMSPPLAANPYRLAEQFWTSELAAAIERRLRTLEALNDDTCLVALAGTLPGPVMRAALLRTLQRHWDEGPKGLESLVTDGPAIEPGFLLVMKMLSRKDAVGPAAGKDLRGRNVNRAVSGGKSTKLAEMREAKQRQEQTARMDGVPKASCVCFAAGFTRQPRQDRIPSPRPN